MANLSEQLTAWRTANQTGYITSQLTIDGALYNLKDPAVAYIAQELDTRLSTLEGATVAAGDVTFNNTGTGLEAAYVQAAIEEVLAYAGALKGTSSDLSSAYTIAAAKKYAEELVDNLAGEDWSENAKKVQDIIEELSGEENAWDTLVDKLVGMTVSEKGTEGQPGYRPANTSPTVVEYVTAAIADVNQQSAEGIGALDKVIYGGSGGVNNGTAANYDADGTSYVAVKLTEEDGLITYLDVKVHDIASATALAGLDSSAVKSINNINPTNGAISLDATQIDMSSTDTTKISAAIAAKANKDALTTDTVNNWSATYQSQNERLAWTNTQTTVYVPVNGKDL